MELVIKQANIQSANMASQQENPLVLLQHMSLMTPKQFSNKINSQTAAEFIAKFDTYRSINNWDNEQAAKHFHLFLTDGPSNWYRTLGLDVQQDFNRLREIFLTTYDAGRNSFYTMYSFYVKSRAKSRRNSRVLPI